jgi:DNA ligase 1
MFIWPMLLEKGNPFTSNEYYFQWKADGIRMILSSFQGEVRCYTRHKTDCTSRFPELQSIPLPESDHVVFDGELVCIHPETKKDDWELVMERFRLTKRPKIEAAVKTSPVIFLAFDVLYFNEPIMNLPLSERKEILEKNIPSSPYITTIPFIDAEGEIYFDQIQKLKLEGCVAKRKNSIYRPGVRSSSADWIKIIRYEYYSDIVITGLRKHKFGYFCAFITDDGLKPAGVIEFATKEHRTYIYSQTEVAFEDQNKKVFKKPLPLVVKTRGRTKNGYLRIPTIHEFI